MVIREVPDSRVSTFEYDVYVDAPPWRTWNAAQDIEGMFKLTSDYRLIGQPKRTGPRSIQMVVEAKPVWYAPAVTGTIAGRLLTDQLGWEDECVAGLFDECYLRFTITPTANGESSLVQATGYFRRPWFISHDRLVEQMLKTFSSVQASINLKVRQEKYSQADQKYPWQEMYQLGINTQPAQKVSTTKQTRLAVQRLLTFPAGETTDAVGAIVTDYLAYQLAGAGLYDVVMPSDINLMARYLGQNWALLCGEDESCKTRMARMAKVDYLLSGELRAEGSEYHLNLVLLSQSEGRAVWRLQRSVPADLGQVKKALEEAVTALEAQNIH